MNDAFNVSDSRLKNCNVQTVGLGRAELFFLAVMKIDRFQQKLSSFKYSLQFDEQTKALSSSLHVLASACDEVMGSNKLAGLLKRLLAIGNLMNESSGKPKAIGITLGGWSGESWRTSLAQAKMSS